MSVRVCVLHAKTKLNAPEDNLGVLLGFLPEIARLAPDVVLTPELLLTGYPLDENDIAFDRAELQAATTKLLTRWPANVPLLLGAPHYAPSAELPTNALVWVANQQETLVCEKHAQTTIPSGHSLVSGYAYGTVRKPCFVKGLTLAPLICCESLDPTIVAQVRALQPGLVVHASAWAEQQDVAYAQIAVADSLFSEELVVVVNQGGPHLGRWSHSESFVYQRHELLLHLKSDASALLWFDIEPVPGCAATYLAGGVVT